MVFLRIGYTTSWHCQGGHCMALDEDDLRQAMDSYTAWLDGQLITVAIKKKGLRKCSRSPLT